MHEKFDDDSFQILAECADGYVGVCRCCCEFNYSYKNILLTFQEPEMCDFFEWLIECRRSRRMELPLPHGKRHVYKSPVYNLFIIHTDAELDEIEAMYMEVKVMLEAMKILN